MNSKVLAVVLLNIVLAHSFVIDDVDRQFQKFKVDFGRVYESETEEQMRRAIFADNLKFIEEHNKLFEQGLVAHEVEVNQFADTLPDERRTSMPVPTVSRVSNVTLLDQIEVMASIPASFDWRAQGKVSAVKNQGQCGSCWSFASSGIIEAAYMIHKNQKLELSEQQMIDCLNTHCGGLQVDTALHYAQTTGLEEYSAYPYTSTKGVAGSCRNDGGRAHHKIAGYGQFGKFSGSPASDEQIQSAVMTYGPVAIVYEACGNDMGLYKGGILTGDLAEKNDDSHWKCSHAVSIVGWGSENNIPYWIVKNSWGNTWGEQGFFRIQRGHDLRGINHWIYYVKM